MGQPIVILLAMRIASLATIPQRSDIVLGAIGSILPQVDELHVFKGNNRLGDANKFKGLGEGYCFTIDDDIIYDSGYIDYMVSKIEEYDRKAVISLHGKVLKRQPIESFYGSDFIKHRCFREVEKDTPIHIPGTGVMGWHADTIDFPLELFKAPNMADIWAGIHCQRNRVPVICVEHQEGFVKRNGGLKVNCYQSNKHRDDLLTETINSIQWMEL